jgi:two-component system, chemotaxis family, protein-glutamate methylesterase/glutaminase
LRMPRLDGVGFIRRQMAVRPLPILVLSAAAQDAAEVIDALNAGAVDVVQKPTALATDDLRSVSRGLVEKIRETMQIPRANLVPGVLRAPASLAAPAARAPGRNQVEIVVLGISTGGPQALRQMLPLLPANFPVPMAIVLHMPIGYTALYAEKLNELCALEVKEAAEGDVVRPGRVLVAAAGRHLVLHRRTSGDVTVQLTPFPAEKIHRPSVDVLFRSAAEVYRDRVLAVVMTGMGDDGKEGCAWVKAQGGTVITESEKSCVIYGMPRSVEEAGMSDAVVPLSDMVQEILNRL